MQQREKVLVKLKKRGRKVEKQQMMMESGRIQCEVRT